MADHSGHRRRVKQEFLARGIDGWPDHRVLELLLFYALPQGDVNPLAHELIDRFETLAGVLDALPGELAKVPGVGEHTAVLLKLLPALFTRYEAERTDLKQIVQTPQEAGRWLMANAQFAAATQETTYILCLNSAYKVLGVRKVAEGSIYAADISIRRIAEEALSLRAASIYLAHNHVSNLAFPSPEDWRATDIIRSSLAGVGIQLIDHLIFAGGEMVSLNQSQQGGKRPVYQLL